jgi:hypothetical protein
MPAFWTRIATQTLRVRQPFCRRVMLLRLRNIDSHPLFVWTEQLAVLISPYIFPFLTNPLGRVAQAGFRDADAPNHPDPAFFLALTDVVNGRREIMTQPNITFPRCWRRAACR